MDAPENVATYIHRVGRTARYRSGGKSLLFLLPSEIAFIDALQSSNKLSTSNSTSGNGLIKVKADPSKMKDITAQFASLCAENTELKFLAQKAFISYVRSISLQGNKEIFKIDQIPFDLLAHSMGLLGTPKVKLPKNNISTSSHAHKEKNMPHKLRELLAEKKDPALRAAKKAAAKAAAASISNTPLTAVEKILLRKNATVFDKSREALRASASSDDEEDEDRDDDEDEILQIKRKNHQLSSSDEEDEDEEDELQLSSESEERSEDDDDEDENEDESKSISKKDNKKTNKTLLRTELAKRASNVRGAQIEPKSADEAMDDGFLASARARVAEQDPLDRAREHERVKAKHLAKKIAIKKAKKAKEDQEENENEEDEDEDDGVVVTLGRPDGESEGEDDDEQMEEDGDSAESEEEGEEEEDEEPAAVPQSKKRKGTMDTPTGKKGAVVATAAAKKQKTTQSLADQEALALKILGGK
jgi:ATP-dependent RNA helicase DDX10/DBP4